MLDRQVQKDVKSKCFENSLALFITDVPCTDFHLYPDLNELFVEGLEETKKRLYKMGLHSVLVMIQVGVFKEELKALIVEMEILDIKFF